MIMEKKVLRVKACGITCWFLHKQAVSLKPGVIQKKASLGQINIKYDLLVGLCWYHNKFY